jgi:hypothetical protein
VDHQYKKYKSTAVVYENVIAKYHHPGTHKYSISGTVLEADMIISVAKLKTHKKTGVTLCLKNAVGVTNEKSWLPHYRTGAPKKGGDSFPDGARLGSKVASYLADFFLSNRCGKFYFKYAYPAIRMAYRCSLKRLLEGSGREDRFSAGMMESSLGNWHGNDTAWRMVLDLNRILLHADKAGRMRAERQRDYLALIDGIWGGDQEGPLHPRVKKAHVLCLGFHPVPVDLVACRLMHFDYRKIPMIAQAVEHDGKYTIDSVNLDDVEIISNDTRWHGVPLQYLPDMDFEPSQGWKGHIEIAE